MRRIQRRRLNEIDQQVEPMDTLIVMRHAESEFNERGILNGDPTIPGGLTQRGREQAGRAREQLATRQVDLCITTNFERSIETADIV